jgi:hypothetical protein
MNRAEYDLLRKLAVVEAQLPKSTPASAAEETPPWTAETTPQDRYPRTERCHNPSLAVGRNASSDR